MDALKKLAQKIKEAESVVDADFKVIVRNKSDFSNSDFKTIVVNAKDGVEAVVGLLNTGNYIKTAVQCFNFKGSWDTKKAQEYIASKYKE